MRVARAFADAPRLPRRAGVIGRIAGLPGRAFAALTWRLGRFRLAPDLDGAQHDDDLWLLLLASDPDGIWYLWPAAERRPQLDDVHHRP